MKKSFMLIQAIALVIVLFASCSETQSMIKKGEEVSFNNGLKVVDYSLEEKVPVKEEVSNNEIDLNYNIAWPIGGPSNLVDNLQKAIIEYLLEEHEAPEGELTIENVLMARYNDVVKETKLEDDEIYSGPISEELTARISVLPGIVILDLDSDSKFRSQMGIFDASDRKVFTDEGDMFDYSVMPDMSTIKPLLLKNMKVFDEDLKPFEYEEQMEHLNYPSKAPGITDKGFEFLWNLNEIAPATQFSSEISYDELLPILSKEAIKFVPSNVIEDFKNNKSTEPSQELLKAYGESQVSDPNNPYISKNFAEVMNLVGYIPTDNPGGIGTYEELLSYWRFGEMDCYGFKITGTEIIPVSENKAKGIIKSVCGGDTNTAKVDLIKETIVYPSGLEGEKWVIDDYNGLKKELISAIEDSANQFKNGLAQEVLDDPYSGGYMSSYEKENYLKEVDRYLKMYKQYKSSK